MARQGYDLQPMRCDDKGWLATFYSTGMPTHKPKPSRIPATTANSTALDGFGTA
jgi:hypothetical protein